MPAATCNPFHTAWRWCLLLILAALPSTQVTAEETPADDSPVIDRLAAFIEAEVEAKQLPATSIALIEGERVIWAAGFGPYGAPDESRASAETSYRVGSVSKLFNALAVMRLVAEGKLDLDADVTTYLPEFTPENEFEKPITLRFLLSHQSGIVREPPKGSYFDASSPSLAATIQSLNETSVVFKPGTRTKYSNAAVSVAGRIVERVSGEPYEEYLQHAVLEPLGMHSSSFRLTDAIEAKLPAAWMWTHYQSRFSAPTFDMGILPAGNLYATVTDLSQLLITLFRDDVPAELGINRDQLHSMIHLTSAERNAGHDYGVGFRLSDLDGHPTFGHGGAVYGYATQFKGLPEEKLGVVVAIAKDGANGATNRIGDYALRLMLAHRSGKSLPEIQTSRVLEPGRASEMAGRYVNGDQTIVLREHDGQAFLKHRFSTGEIRQHGDRYVIDDVLRHGPTLQWDKEAGTIQLEGKEWTLVTNHVPLACPPRWRELIGEYGWDHNILYIYEDSGQLRTLIEWFYDYPLAEISADHFAFPDAGLYHDEEIHFIRDASGQVTHAEAGGVRFPRRVAGEPAGDHSPDESARPPR